MTLKVTITHDDPAHSGHVLVVQTVSAAGAVTGPGTAVTFGDPVSFYVHSNQHLVVRELAQMTDG